MESVRVEVFPVATDRWIGVIDGERGVFSTECRHPDEMPDVAARDAAGVLGDRASRSSSWMTWESHGPPTRRRLSLRGSSKQAMRCPGRFSAHRCRSSSPAGERSGSIKRMAADEQRRLADTFDSVADEYERARPTYPPALFDDLARLGALSPASRILEIGPGTGQATRHLAERGWTVRGIEPGEQLARVARRVLAAYPTVDIDVQKFESWSSEGDFDMVFAATSWHWLDPRVAYRHAADLLRQGGFLAIVTTDHVRPEGGDDFFVDVQAVYRAIGQDDGGDGPPKPDEVDRPLLDDLTSTALFEQPNVRTYLSPITYTAEQYLAVLATYSNHIAMDEPDRAVLFDRVQDMINSRPGKKITKHYLNTLYVARRRA
jgi:SAM-dependent methyltransferase